MSLRTPRPYEPAPLLLCFLCIGYARAKLCILLSALCAALCPLCCVLRAACCVLRAACCVLRAACCVLNALALCLLCLLLVHVVGGNILPLLSCGACIANELLNDMHFADPASPPRHTGFAQPCLGDTRVHTYVQVSFVKMQMNARSAEFTEFDLMRVCVCSYNVNGRKPPRVEDDSQGQSPNQCIDPTLRYSKSGLREGHSSISSRDGIFWFCADLC